ncbi:MAG: hypothetical protein IK082_00755 [Oscillospiraceae bacterium]|nr:hypothetical protein [Oscillospiraceae bacterium]
MKKTLLFLLCFLLVSASVFAGCSRGEEKAYYFNTDTGCLLGNTLYQSMGGDYFVWNPDAEEIRYGLCRDALCTHKDTDSICPDNVWLWNKTVITDGEKLFLNVQNALLTDVNGAMFRQIYSMKPDGTEFRLLYTYEASGNTSPVMRCMDGYLYFEQGFYRKDPENLTNLNDQYKNILRISTGGGKPEVVIGEEMNMNSTYYIDETKEYLVSEEESCLTVTDRETGIVTRQCDIEGIPVFVRIYEGQTYLIAAKPITVVGTRADGSEARKRFDSYILYRLEHNEFQKLAEGVFTFTLDGIWSSEVSYDYIGTKSAQEGAYGETEEKDYFSVTTKKLYKMTENGKQVEEIRLGEDFRYGDEIEIVSGANGKLLVNCSNQKQFFETGDSQYRTCLLAVKDGSVIIEKIYEN